MENKTMRKQKNKWCENDENAGMITNEKSNKNK